LTDVAWSFFPAGEKMRWWLMGADRENQKQPLLKAPVSNEINDSVKTVNAQQRLVNERSDDSVT